MRTSTQFSISLVNRPGALAAVTGALAEAGINLVAMTLGDVGDGGLLRVVCDDADAARSLLRDGEDPWRETEVLVVEMTHRPGGFAEVARRLGEAHVNITYAYATAGAKSGKVLAVLKVADINRAQEALQ